MEDKSKYFVVKQKAVPEVLLKVVEAKKLLETERAITVQEATEKVGISRSSRVQGQYPDHPPEHPGQRRGYAYAERGGKGEYRQCIQHDRGTGSTGRNPLRQDTCQGVMAGRAV